MRLKDKSVLVIGMGISGLSTIKFLYSRGSKVSVFDKKTDNELSGILANLKSMDLSYHLGQDSMDLSGIELIVKSPGVAPYSQIIQKARNMGIEIITDIELAYRLSPSKNIVAITGSNGKTTTSNIVGEAFAKSGLNTFLVGNIGVGILDRINQIQKDDIIVIEASSFQLEDTLNFKPQSSLILNISPDHLDWHGSYENYINAKKKIYKNQDKYNYTVLNYDDEIIRDLSEEVNSKIIWFSIENSLDKGIYMEDDDIIINIEKKVKLMNSNDLKIMGKHNLQNVLGSIGVLYSMGLDLKTIREELIEFSGIEHRLEYVLEKNKRKFYNDSKGTNPEASIKAIEAIKSPIILIAGGYNKNSDFEKFIKAFKKKGKALILFGDTKDEIKECALKYGFKENYIVENMNEAVLLAYKLSIEGDNILLSPACASWGMYKNFEERGRDFKNQVKKLGEE